MTFKHKPYEYKDIQVESLRLSENKVLAVYELGENGDIEHLKGAVLKTLEHLSRQYQALKNPKLEMDVVDVEELVCNKIGIDSITIRSKNRQRDIVVARQICMALSVKHTKFTQGYIGYFFGGKDHSTVTHAKKTVWNTVVLDKHYGPLLEEMDEILGEQAEVCKINRNKAERKELLLRSDDSEEDDQRNDDVKGEQIDLRNNYGMNKGDNLGVNIGVKLKEVGS